MAAKADKDALKKNAFWFALGGFVVLWLVAVLFVMMAGDAEKKKAWEGAKSGIEAAAKSPKNESFFAPWDKYGEAATGHKDKVWADGWNQQKDIYTWPDMGWRLSYPTDPFGNTARDELDRRGKFRDDYKTQFAGLDTAVSPAEYRGGFAAVFPQQAWDGTRAPSREEIWLAQEDFWVRREMVNVVVDAMNSVALFKDLTDEAVPLDQVPKEVLDAAAKKHPKGKALSAVRETVEGKVTYEVTVEDGGKAVKVALTPEGKDGARAKLPDGVQARKVYRNANWELDLLFVKAEDKGGWQVSADSTIKNVNRTQKLQPLASVSSTLGVPFRFYQFGGGNVVIRIAGEPLAFEQSAKLGKPYSLNPISPHVVLAKGSTQRLGVQQVMEWETSPIRQVDALELSLHSHRTVTWGLKINEELKKIDPEPVVEGADPATPASGPPPGMVPPMPGAGGAPPPPGGLGGAGGFGGAASVDSTKINFIKRPRYMHVTKQCRHLPVALKVTVDQSHIHDVIGAVTNSPLRIQVTQVAFHNVPTPPRPNAALPGSGTTTEGPGGMVPPMPMGGLMPPRAGGPPPRAGGPPPMAGGPMGMYPGGRAPGMYPGGYPGGAGFRSGDDLSGGGGIGGPGVVVKPGETAAQVQDNAKMVELTVYGIATLYERFPAAPAAPEAPK